MSGRAEGGGRLQRASEKPTRSEEHTSELQSPYDLVCRLLPEKKKRRTEALLRKQAEPGGPTAATAESPLAKLLAGAQGPVDIEPSPDTPIIMRMTNTSDLVYR